MYIEKNVLLNFRFSCGTGALANFIVVKGGDFFNMVKKNLQGLQEIMFPEIDL